MSLDFQRKDLVVNDTVQTCPYYLDGIGSAAFPDEGLEQNRVRCSYQDVSTENLQEGLIVYNKL